MDRQSRSESVGPPRLWEALLEAACPERLRDALVADLRQEYIEHVLPALGPKRSARWYRSQVIRSLPHQLRVGWADVRERRHGRRGDGIVTTFFQDLRYGLRSIRLNPLFSAVVVLTLGLGIGANTMIYSVVDGLVFNPFPFPDAETLVDIGSEYPQLNRPLTFFEHMSPAEFEDIKSQSRTLENVVAWDMGNRQIATENDAINVLTGFWWGDGFKALEVTPPVGRGFLQEEIDQRSRVAVISSGLWLNQFGEDPEVIGRVLQINGNPYEIVGVMPPRSELYGMDLWIPMPVGPEVYPRNRRQFQVIGRIVDGFTMEDVATELEGLARRTEAEYGQEFQEYAGFRLVPMTWTRANVRQFRSAAFVLLAAVGFVLLIVCANVANLLLARSSTRRREVAVRTSLGATRRRLLRQLLTESTTLSLVGAALGVGISLLGIQWVRRVVDGIPFVSGEVALNHRALIYTGVVALTAGIVFGLAPALQSMAGDLRGVLSAEGGASTGSRSRGRLQRIFIGAEVALALILLVGGGLLLNSMIRMAQADPGFDHSQLLSMRLTLPWEEYEGDEIAQFFEGLSERVRAIPGVEAATVGSQFPPITFSANRIALEGQEAVEEGRLPVSYVTHAGDDYFPALGVRLIRGRHLDATDTRETPWVVVVNESFASRYLPDQDPIGKRVRVGSAEGGDWVEIVGLVADTYNRGFSENPQPELFGSVRQLSGMNNQLFLLVRTEGEPRSVLPAIRTIVREMDPDQPIYAIQTMEEIFDGAVASQRFASMSLMSFALFALTLASLGIYAVVAYTVAERSREIGLRMALGAPAKRVRTLVVRQTLVPVAIGALVGVVLAAVAGRGLSSMLYEVTSTDPVTLAAVVVLFIGAAGLASYVPARRASRVDPAHTLRD